MSGLQKILFYFSWLILLSALLLHLFPVSPLPFPLPYLLPVLLTGAIGFLTNFLAIEMLFKPYTAESASFRRIFSADFWRSGGLLRLITLGFWKTGLVPANKPQIGKKLGEEIPRRLLKEDELSRQLAEALAAFPDRHPEFSKRLLQAVIRATAESPEFIRTLGDFLKKSEDSGVPTPLFSAETLQNQLQKFTRQWFDNQENRRLLVRLFTEETEKNLEYIRNLLRDAIQASAAGIMQQQSPLIAMFGGNMIGSMLKNYDWTQLDNVILEKLTSDETQEKMMQACNALPERISSWAAGENGQHQLAEAGNFLHRQFLENLSGRLAVILPDLGSSLLESPAALEWMAGSLIPALQTELSKWFQTGGQQEIIGILALSRRIEDAVNVQDIREFHQMVNDVADRHLNAIQVLGFFIGLVIGIIQII